MNPTIPLLIAGYGTLMAGAVRNDQAQMDAFNTETEREEGEVLAMQQAAQRRYEYDIATKTNVAIFAASGRDIGSDRSVEAFFKKQKEIAAQDLSRIAENRQAEASARTREAASYRIAGKNAKRASLLKAGGDFAQGLSDNKKVVI
tara:strand:- start:2094 stop:2531 length:438 start_codon:yes stop_codon:yes gene_type:complete